ncbi:MAG: GTP-binding protein [Myxococcota bacterium]
MVHVDLVTGFLGAGKTTVVRRLLAGRPAGERVGVVVNDFGDAAFDAAALAAGGGELREIAGACVCCTAPDGFVAAVRELLDRVDRIVVEPTGLARPVDLVDTLRRAPYADRIAIGPLIVLIDPHALAVGAIPRELLDQAANADVLVASRADLATDAELAALRHWASGLWPGPLRVLEARHGELPADVLDWPDGAGPRTASRQNHDHDHDHDQDHAHAHAHADHAHADAFGSRSWVWPPDVGFSRTRLLAAAGLSGLARFKGLFRTDEGTIEVQRASDSVHEVPSGWRRDSRCDVIAADPAVVAAAAEALHRAILTPDELRRRRHGVEVAVGGALARVFDRDALAALPDPVPDVSVAVPGRAGAAVRLAEVLRAAGAAPDATVVVVARDGYVTPRVPWASIAGALLVHSLGAAPLPDDQGGPFRLLNPAGGPCANVKGVVRIAVD